MICFQNIYKRFGKFEANRDISFEVQPGTCHGIIGENGAGKSTLMNLLYGLYQPSSGQIIYQGKTLNCRSPKQAIEIGIGMVHQHFKLILSLSVWENIVLCSEKQSYLLRSSLILKELNELQEKHGFHLDLSQSVSDLSLGQRQQVEILKLLYRKADVFILDEPTALLTPLEATFLFKQIEELRKQGKTVLLITHKLDEVIKHTQFVTVLRKGAHCGTFPTSSQTEKSLSREMMGKEREVLLRRKEVSTSIALRLPFNDSTLTVHKKEIVGIAGMDGQGQSELIDSVLSFFSRSHGSLYQARQRGFSFIPSDRQEEGLILPFPNGTNLILGHQRERTYQNKKQLYPGFYFSRVASLLTDFNVYPSQVECPTLTLSGGNQQKVIIARETHRPVQFLLACQPTRGVDIGAMDYIHTVFLNLAEQGAGILLISSDLDELLNLSDRIAVIRNKKITTIKKRSDFSMEELGLLMAGVGS